MNYGPYSVQVISQKRKMHSLTINELKLVQKQMPKKVEVPSDLVKPLIYSSKTKHLIKITKEDL